jgi:hypothetical protein
LVALSGNDVSFEADKEGVVEAEEGMLDENLLGSGLPPSEVSLPPAEVPDGVGDAEDGLESLAE